MRTFPFVLAIAAGCLDTEQPHEHNDNEVITTVILEFTPQTGGETSTFSWSDPQSLGSPVVDEVLLSNTGAHDLFVSFLNALEDPAEDLTVEIEDEGTEHQVFFTGTALDDGLITHAYADSDDNGDPIGLQSTITTQAVGVGTLIVTLRHLPPEDGTPVKTGTLAEDLSSSGFGALPGGTDAQVTFQVEVQ